jgi:hypothetical protein
MTTTDMHRKLHPSMICAVIAATLALAACNRQESAQETREDVAEERREGARNMQDAREEAREDADGGSSLGGNDQTAVAREKVRTDYEVAVQQCESLTPDAQEQCKDDAEKARDRELDRIRAMTPLGANPGETPR